MRAFVDLTGIRIGDECFGKKRIKDTANGVMQKSVTDCGFMNIARFWIADIKCLIRPVFVGMIE